MTKSTPNSLDSLARKAAKGDRRAISQIMSVAENDPRARLRVLSSLYWKTGKAYVIGITGPPGCGKSTLITQLVKRYRSTGSRVGVVAVDPTSQVTGGALLGDRIRMGDLASDPEVFIRSMATRGHFGGVARATEDVVRILDASAMNYVIVETAGAGQSDVDVKTLAHTTIVVTAPGLGDEIQALKAGIMEIGDIFVVNKSDKEDADLTAQEIYSMISMAEPVNGWRQHVLKTNSITGEGVVALVEAINQHSQYVRNSGQFDRLEVERLRHDLLDAAKRYFEDVKLEELTSTNRFKRLLAQVEARETDPYTAARRMIRWIGKSKIR